MGTIGIFFLSLLIGAAALYLLALLGIFLFQKRLIYVPDRSVWRTPSDAGLAHEEVFLTAADGVHLHGWFIPSHSSRGTVLFFHGNAGNIAHRVDTAERFQKWELNTFMIDYRGYGNSDGKPSERGTRMDAEAAWNFLVERKGLSPEKIVIFGRSLGAGVAADLAARVHPAGVVLESGFTSLADLGASLYPWFPVRLICRHRYPTMENASKCQCPVLVAHSRDDDLIPFSHGERIFAAAPDPKFFLEMLGTHRHCVSTTGVSYERAIKSFLYEALLSSPSESRR